MSALRWKQAIATNNRSFANSLLLFSLLLSALSIAPVWTECARKVALPIGGAETEEGGQPGLRPAKQFIQTSFLHRDHDGQLG